MGYRHESFYYVEEDEVYKGDSMQMMRPNQYGPTRPNNFVPPPHQGGCNDGSSHQHDSWSMDKPSHGSSNQYHDSWNMDKPSHGGSNHDGWKMDKPSPEGWKMDKPSYDYEGWKMDKPSYDYEGCKMDRPSHEGWTMDKPSHEGWKMDKPSHDGWKMDKPSYGDHKTEYSGDMHQYKVGGGGYHSAPPRVPFMEQTAPVNQYHNNCRPDQWNFRGIDD